MKKQFLVALMIATTVSMTGCGFNIKLGPSGVEYETYGSSKEEAEDDTEEDSKTEEKKKSLKDKETEAEETEAEDDTEETEKTSKEEDSNTGSKIKREKKEDKEPEQKKADSADTEDGDDYTYTEIGIEQLSVTYPGPLELIGNEIDEDGLAMYIWADSVDNKESQVVIMTIMAKDMAITDDTYDQVVDALNESMYDFTGSGEILTDRLGQKWDVLSGTTKSDVGIKLDAGLASTKYDNSVYMIVWASRSDNKAYGDKMYDLIFNNTEFAKQSFDETQFIGGLNYSNPAVVRASDREFEEFDKAQENDTESKTNTEKSLPKKDTNTNTASKETKGSKGYINFKYPDYFEESKTGSMYFTITGADTKYYKYDTGKGHSEKLSLMIITPEAYSNTTWDSYESIDDVVKFIDRLYDQTLNTGFTTDKYTDESGNTWKLYNSHNSYDVAMAVGEVNGSTLVMEWSVYGDATDATQEQLFEAMKDIIDSCY